MKAIYKFDFWARGGMLTGIFVADKDEVAKAMGSCLYFGEALGKHSSVTIDLEDSHLEVTSEDPVLVELFEKAELETGYNPLHYIQWECENCNAEFDGAEHEGPQRWSSDIGDWEVTPKPCCECEDNFGW